MIQRKKDIDEGKGRKEESDKYKERDWQRERKRVTNSMKEIGKEKGRD